MPIAQLGTINISALNVPQALVQIVPPQFLFGGASTNMGGIIGTACWGPVGTAQNFGGYSDGAQIFGPTINRYGDLMASTIIAQKQGAANLWGVRVTDGTDVAATATIQTSCLTVTGRYTGTLGNTVKVTIGAGTKVGTFKVIVSCPSLPTEVFDNIGSGLTGNALWVAIAAAINSGTSGVRPGSNIIVASAGAGTTAPTSASYTLSGGTDGASSVTSANLIGVDTLPRTGMYALRGTNVARFILADCYDTSVFSTMVAFGLDIGAEAIMATQPSDTISNFETTVSTLGVDAYAGKLIFGDWIVWYDTVNGVAQRITSPAAAALGKRCALSPQKSTLNKPIAGIVGTQASALGKTYGYNDFQRLAAARGDLICIDKTLTNNFVFRLGVNTSSNDVTKDDSYTDVTNFLAKSILVIANYYVGENIDPDEMRRAKVSLQEFLALAQTNGIIGTIDGSQAWQVVLDTTNNTQSTAALGFQFAYVKAIYKGVVRYFIVNLEGGASVTISETAPR